MSKPRTEQEMVQMIERKLRSKDAGNGPAWVVMRQVRNAAGFDATRTADVVAMALWPSRGLELHGYEIKVSRSDWQRELQNPHKAELFTKLVDRWWIVVPDPTIVAPGELPPGWGLMVERGGSLRTEVQADLLIPMTEAGLTKTRVVQRTFLAAMLRAAARTHDVQPEEVQAAVQLERERQEARWADEVKRERARGDRYMARIEAFQKEAGVTLGTAPGEHDPYPWHGKRPAAEVGAALRLVLSGEADVRVLEDRVRNIADTAERLAADARKVAGKREVAG